MFSSGQLLAEDDDGDESRDTRILPVKRSVVRRVSPSP